MRLSLFRSAKSLGIEKLKDAIEQVNKKENTFIDNSQKSYTKVLLWIKTHIIPEHQHPTLEQVTSAKQAEKPSPSNTNESTEPAHKYSDDPQKNLSSEELKEIAHELFPTIGQL